MPHFNPAHDILPPFSQQYAWGKKGSDSVVAKLKGLGDAEYTVKPEETYAEMWIGTHPSGPSRVVRDGSPGPLLKVLFYYFTHLFHYLFRFI